MCAHRPPTGAPHTPTVVWVHTQGQEHVWAPVSTRVGHTHVTSVYSYAQVQEHAQALASTQGVHTCVTGTRAGVPAPGCAAPASVCTQDHTHLGGTMPHGSTHEVQGSPRHPKHQGSTADSHPTPVEAAGSTPKHNSPFPLRGHSGPPKAGGVKKGSDSAMQQGHG